MLPRLCRAGALLAVLVGVGACGGDPAAPDPHDPALSPRIPSPADAGLAPLPFATLRDPVQVVRLHADAIEARDFRLYRALLARDFRYRLRVDDVGQIACGGFSDSWDLPTELRLWRHMSSPHFQGDEPPVQSIEVDLSILEARGGWDDGQAEVLANATIVVLVAPDAGWLTDTAFRFTLQRQDGQLRISTIEEIRRRASPAVEEATWASIKCLYW